MRRCLYVVATANTINSGVVDCVKQGLISSRDYYYHYWAKDKYWRAAMLPLRAQLIGENREMCRQMLEHNHQQFIISLINISNDSSHKKQLAAIEDCLSLLDYTQFSRRGDVNVTVSQTIADKQATFLDRQKAAQADRHSRLIERGLLEPVGDDEAEPGRN